MAGDPSGNDIYLLAQCQEFEIQVREERQQAEHLRTLCGGWIQLTRTRTGRGGSLSPFRVVVGYLTPPVSLL